MQPVKTDKTNTTFVADDCADLPAARFNYTDGSPGIETCWELSDEEIQEIIKNKRVFVYMLGYTVPPMYVTTKSSLDGSETNNE